MFIRGGNHLLLVGDHGKSSILENAAENLYQDISYIISVEVQWRISSTVCGVLMRLLAVQGVAASVPLVTCTICLYEMPFTTWNINIS